MQRGYEGEAYLCFPGCKFSCITRVCFSLSRCSSVYLSSASVLNTESLFSSDTPAATMICPPRNSNSEHSNVLIVKSVFRVQFCLLAINLVFHIFFLGPCDMLIREFMNVNMWLVVVLIVCDLVLYVWLRLEETKQHCNLRYISSLLCCGWMLAGPHQFTCVRFCTAGLPLVVHYHTTVHTTVSTESAAGQIETHENVKRLRNSNWIKSEPSVIWKGVLPPLPSPLSLGCVFPAGTGRTRRSVLLPTR